MRILFAMSSPEYLRFYDSTIVALADRGHEVVIAVNAVRDGKPVRLDTIEGEHPRVRVAGVIPPRGDGWEALARAVRGTQDFVRYLHPRLASASRLRERVKRQALPWILHPLDRFTSLQPRTVGRVLHGLEAVERAIPVSPAIAAFLDAQAPDLVLVSPLVEPASEQVDLVRAAHARGTRVGALIASWDNLTNKGDLRVRTDFVAVWNEAQKREAIEFHRVPPDRIVVTGAQPFDRWFARTPGTTREAFCRQVGLPDTRPFVLYTGSSIFIARADAEMPFVRRWIEALRTSADPAVRDLAVLVRPHPYNGRAWRPEVLSDLPDVAVWPRGGFDPVDEGNRAAFFDTMHHAAAVVGINTSAMIESAIVGRPVLSIEVPEFAGTQEGTLHYRHLLPENGGFLRVASGFGQHLQQLSEVLAKPDVVREELSRFVRTFVRPHGMDRAATPILADAIERLGSPLAADTTAGTVRAHVSSGTGQAAVPAVTLGVIVLWPLARVAPLFMPDVSRRFGAWRLARESWRRLQRGRRVVSSRVADARIRVGRAQRRTFGRVRAEAKGALARIAKRPMRAVRQARYQAGLVVRRWRGVPTK